MDYETGDGSQFSLRDIWTERNGEPAFDYTNVTAYVDGRAYVGRLHVFPEEVDQVDILNSLKPVPVECIHPPSSEKLTLLSKHNAAGHYMKAPSFTWDDCQPGQTFVADRVLNEVHVLERLKSLQHPNLVQYHGSIIEDGRITHICLRRYPHSLVEYAKYGLSEFQKQSIVSGVQAGLRQLHSIGLAHNDISPYNVCIDDEGRAVIIDFDCCLPFGQKLVKGIGSSGSDLESSVSSPNNDLKLGLNAIEDFLWINTRSKLEDDPSETNEYNHYPEPHYRTSHGS